MTFWLKLFSLTLYKGIYNKEAQKPKYQVMCEPDLVLNYVNYMGNNRDLNLKVLILKTVIVVVISSQRRVQTIFSPSRNNFKR